MPAASGSPFSTIRTSRPSARWRCCQPRYHLVATGEQTEGEGIFKSTDAGATWTNVGLRDAASLTSLIVDPRNPDVVLVVLGEFLRGRGAACSAPKTAARRGTRFYSRTKKPELSTCPWIRVIIELCMPPSGAPDFGPPSQGRTTKIRTQFTRRPTAASLGSRLEARVYRAGPGTHRHLRCPGDHGKRVFAIVNQGVFRSDDAGTSWRRIANDPRVLGNGYFSRIFSDPKNPDVLYVMQTAVYRSTDGGQIQSYTGRPVAMIFTFSGSIPRIRANDSGCGPGRHHRVDGGKTWGDWLNQPTGQFYHVTTDEPFPTTSMPNNRIPAPSPSPIAATTARSPIVTGSPSAASNSAIIAADPLIRISPTPPAGTTPSCASIARPAISFHIFPGKKALAGGTSPSSSRLSIRTQSISARRLLKSADGGIHGSPSVRT